MGFQITICRPGFSQNNPKISFIQISIYTHSICITGTEIELRFCLTLLSSFQHPFGGLSFIFRHTITVEI